MLKYVTQTLFLLFATSPFLSAMSEPRCQVLPGGVHTYVWNCGLMSFDDRIELRLVVPAGLVHEKESEAGAAAALAHLISQTAPQFLEDEGEAHYFEPYSWKVTCDTSYDGATFFEISIPYYQYPLIAKAIDMLAQWAWGWSPEGETMERSDWRELRPYQLEVAAYGGREGTHWPEAPPSSDTLIEFYNRTYRALPIAVIVVGELETERVEELLSHAFSHPPSGDLGPLPHVAPTGSWKTPITFQNDLPSSVEIYLPTKHPLPLSVREAVAEFFFGLHLANHLGPGSVYASPYGLTTTCLLQQFEMMCETRDIMPTLEALEATCQEMADRGIDSAALEEIRKEIEEDVLPILPTPKMLAHSCAHHFCGHTFLWTEDNLVAFEQAVATLTSDDVKALAATLQPFSAGKILVDSEHEDEILLAQLERFFSP